MDHHSRLLLSFALSGLLSWLAVGCASSPPEGGDDSTETQSAEAEAKPAQQSSASAPSPSESAPSARSVSSDVDLPDAEEFDADRAYVATIGTGTITALDLESNEVAWTLKVSEATEDRAAESAMGIAATHDGSTVFTGDVTRDELVVVDADKREVAQRIPLEHGIHAIDLCPHGHWLWVSGRTSDHEWLGATTIFNAKTLEKVATVSSGLGYAAHFAFSPNGKTAWAASVTTNLVWSADAKSGAIRRVVPTGEQRIPGESPEAKMGLIGLNEVAISPDGSRAYAVGPDSGTIYVIDTADGRILASIDAGERTHGVAVTRDGREVWTANNAGSVTVVDAESLEVVDQLDLDREIDSLPFAHIAFSIDGKTAYVSWSESLSVFDVASHRLVDEIETDASPHEITLEDYYVEVDGSVTGSTDDSDAGQTAASGDESDEEGDGAAKRTSKAAGIEVVITPKRRDDSVAFEMALNTHSGDLTSYDVVENAAVVVDGSEVEADKLTWNEGSGDSHHRTGELVVDTQIDAGSTILVVLADLGVPSREFEWTSFR